MKTDNHSKVIPIWATYKPKEEPKRFNPLPLPESLKSEPAMTLMANGRIVDEIA